MSPASPVLRLEYLPASRMALQPDGWLDSVLGVACFGSGSSASVTADIPFAQVDMPPLDGVENVCEVWHCSEPLRSGTRGGIRYRQGETVLYGILNRDEDSPHAGRSPLQNAAEAAYQEIFDLLESEGYSAVLRFWNYFPDINRETHGMERYRQFNVGRQDAFLAHGRSVIDNVPAACALGSASGALTVAFLAVRANVVGLENPRQLSAFRYPSQYGPRSPTFSRAGLLRLGGRDMLFISGTASIVGHQSLHDRDAAAQTRESMNNIAAIVEAANRQAPEARFNLADLCYKVYVRHPEDAAAVRQELERFVGSPVLAIHLRADVCRTELLVEIEASGGHPTQFQ
jgi:enamine deaminase RidA (YjgF/YER057c/UK114 family)